MKDKIVAATGSVSGATGILGSWQICHNLCLGLIWLLSIVGITASGMPLLFLTKIAIPVWMIAMLLFVITTYMYIYKKCIAKSLWLFNAGLFIAGVPFPELQPYQLLFWVAGGFVAFCGIIIYLEKKSSQRPKYVPS